MAHTLVTPAGVRFKLRTIAPGELELTIVAGLQYGVALALLIAPERLLAGNGTALLTLTNYPSLTPIAKSIWMIVFLAAGVFCHRAVIRPSIQHRKWAWQLVIPLWACWFMGLCYPLFVSQPTNVIILMAVATLVSQWLLTRFLVPLDSHWYSRVVPVSDGEHFEEGSSGDQGDLAVRSGADTAAYGHGADSSR